MSNIKRYEIKSVIELSDKPSGDYVLFSEHEQLVKELEGETAQIKHLWQQDSCRMVDEIQNKIELQAKLEKAVEALKEAGADFGRAYSQVEIDDLKDELSKSGLSYINKTNYIAIHQLTRENAELKAKYEKVFAVLKFIGSASAGFDSPESWREELLHEINKKASTVLVEP